jgi:hypothetical protein
VDPKRIVADGYDALGSESRLGLCTPARGSTLVPGRGARQACRGSAVLELGCGPGTDAAELSGVYEMGLLRVEHLRAVPIERALSLVQSTRASSMSQLITGSSG